jgi:16S rRNA processing protein RimM
VINKEKVFKAGYFSKPHGVKGEIGIVTARNIPEKDGDPFLICEMDGILVPFFIEYCRNKTKTVRLVKLVLVDTEEAAREFTGKDVYFPVDAMEKGEQPGGDTAWSGLTGYTVCDKTYGELGIITGVDESTINILLRIDHNGRELLIPAVAGWILSRNPAAKRMEISAPEGLLEQ